MATTRRTTKTKPMNVPLTQDVEPLRLVTKRPEDRAPEERVELFSIDDTSYTIPKKFPVGLGLKVIRTARRSGQEIAMAELLEEVIGSDAYDALVNYKDLEDEHLERLMNIVNQLALGSLEGPKGHSASA